MMLVHYVRVCLVGDAGALCKVSDTGALGVFVSDAGVCL